MINQKATKSQKLMNELNADPEKQVALVLWLLEGGKFDFAKEQATTETANSLRDLLNRRKESTRSYERKEKKTGNPFDRIAEQVAQGNFR